MTYKCIGLMSGTSLDGIDAALVNVSADGNTIHFLHGITRPFSDSLRKKLMGLAVNETVNKEELARMDALMGHLLSDVVEQLLKESGTETKDILLVASHGQTIGHYPDKENQYGHSIAFTLQIGDGDVMAARTGIPVVSDFRRRDMAVGGEGAPLIPLLDSLLFQNTEQNRCCLNIGGIANITVLPACGSTPMAFDTGPGNCLSDLAAARLIDHGLKFDPGGENAFCGKIHDEILDRAMADAYFTQLPPKSTSREYFDEKFLNFLLGLEKNVPFGDMVATVSCLTPRSIADALHRFVPVDNFPKEMIVSGGGVHNRFFMEKLKLLLPEMNVVSSGKYGIDPDFKEAMGFALMGYRTMKGLPSSIPEVTGARLPQILGKISLTTSAFHFFQRDKGDD
ncbi:MAG: anhydro-N-acetylmuramic acid kinase [Acidobacteria bacterium]|nr:anhydro-N-acetylmuramic acid kinase [Acidobacteriota bacterium]